MKNVVLFLRNSAGHIIAGSLILAGGLIVAGMYATIESPYTGEIFTNYVISFGLTATCILVGIFGAVMVRGMYLSATDVTHKMAPPLSLREQFESVFGPMPALAPKPAALPATANAFDISPDILLVRRAGEPEAEYLARVEAAAGVSTRIRWAVAIPFRSPVLTIFDGGNPVVYQRDEPIFVLPEWPDYDGRIVPAGTPFTAETEKQYTEYISTFSRNFREWAPRKKPQMYRDAMRGMSVLELMRTAAVSVFLLLSVSAFGQSKTEQVVSAFNGRPGIPPSGVEITYDFGSKTVYRMADGRKNYAELLSGVPGFQDAGGKLVAVYAGTSKVATAQDVQDVAPRTNIGPGLGYVTESNTGDPVRPRGVADGSVIQPAPEQYRQFAMPDSSESAAMAERMKYEIWRMGEYGGRLAKPWWEVVMEAFWVLYPVLITLATIAYICARAFSSEGMLDQHKIARRSLVYILLTIAGVIAINILVWAISIRMHPLGLTALALIISGIAVWAVTRLTPNFNPAPGNEPERGQANGGYFPAAQRGR